MQAMIAIAASMLLMSQVPADAPVAITTRATPMTLGDLERLGPERLADALLAAGHAPVERATIGPQELQPPQPPGPASDTSATIYLVPTDAAEPLFCRRVVAKVTMSPVSRDVPSRQASYRPTAVETLAQYRWAGRPGPTTACAAPGGTFFRTDADLGQRQFGIVRAAAEAAERAGRGRRPSFPVTVDDPEGRLLSTLEADRPAASARREAPVIYRDPIKALAVVPIAAVFDVRPTSPTYAEPFTEAEVRDAIKRDLVDWTIRAADWTVGVTTKGERIVSMRLVRAVPAPF